MLAMRKGLHELAQAPGDREMLATLLTARSSAEAALAFSLLQESLPREQLVFLANVRETLVSLPEGPFTPGESLELLVGVLDFEDTGTSYRRLYEDDSGLFGIEFLGRDKFCRGIVLRSINARCELTGDEQDFVDPVLVDLVLEHPGLLDHLGEALQVIGVAVEPTLYATVADYLSEQAAVAVAALNELF